jgi:hypothetical protein
MASMDKSMIGPQATSGAASGTSWDAEIDPDQPVV